MTGRILVVDDEEIVRRTVASILSQFAVTSAADGQEALDLFEDQAFDLVIADLRMPRLGGDELLHQLRRLDPDMPVIILTGFGTMSEAIRALREGAYDFLTKPIEIPLLLQAVERALENRRLLLENKQYLARLEQFNAELERKVAERTRQLSGMNEIHHYIASNVFDTNTVLSFAAGAISRALGLSRCVIYVTDEQGRIAARGGCDGGAAIPAPELRELPAPAASEVDEILGPGVVLLEDGDGAIQAERGQEEGALSADELEGLRDFSPPVRLAVKLARIYENITEDVGGEEARTDADAILAEIEAFDRRGEGAQDTAGAGAVNES